MIGACAQRSCRGIGYDIEPQRIQEAEENARLHKVEHLVKFERADVFELDLRPASVVLLYLLPRMVQDLVPQFEQCSPGTRIVSEDWAIDGVQADEQREVLLESGERHTLFLYTLPLRRKT